MKIRTGFVSNSSSSSFCAFGVIAEADKEFLENWGMVFTDEDLNEDGDFMEDLLELVYNEVDKHRLLCHQDYDSRRAYIGISYTSMADDETMIQFKARVKETVKKMFPKIPDIEFQHLEESWSQ